MIRYLALLRGVNIGGRRIGMADLRALLTGLGYRQVATYLQSGNGVFQADDPDPASVRSRVETALATGFGFPVPTLIRTHPEIHQVVTGCPYRREAEADPTKVHVVFAEVLPARPRLEEVAAAVTGSERFAVGDSVIYMHLPEGMGRAKLPDLLAKATTGTVTTTRNWRTVTNLEEMLTDSTS